MLKTNFLMMSLLVVFLVASISHDTHAKTDSKNCPLIGAEYTPHPSYKKANDLDFILTFGENNDPDLIKAVFMYVDAYQNQTKVSRMRLGDTMTNGSGRQWFLTDQGQYLEDKNWTALTHTITFSLMGVNKDFSEGTGYFSRKSTAPYLLILNQGDKRIFLYAKENKNEWDRYIKFYTDARIFPDFYQYGFWIRQKCGVIIDGGGE